MTAVDVLFHYGRQPGERVMRALAELREVYGIRRVQFHAPERTVRVEFDASRLSEDIVAGLLRGSGLDLREKVALV